MNQTVPDRRVQKTRRLLQEALMQLVTEKGYEAITIREILDRSDVGRSTFYAHFQDKDQLLHSILDRLDELFSQHKQQFREATQHPAGTGTDPFSPELSPTLSLFQFVGQNHRFFKTMLGNRGYSIFAKPVYDYVFGHVHGIFTQPADRGMFAHLHQAPAGPVSPVNYGPLESEIAAHYFVSALVGILVWWVEKDMPCTAEEIDGLFRQMAMPGFQQIMAMKHGS